MIKAPYNFVPLENDAFYPSWSGHISQDIPFEDGVSGSLEYKMTALTPIFVRNGNADRENQEERFSNVGGDCFIPGTSVKGEIRSVLEVLSFGKMTQYQDGRFGIRDLSTTGNGPYYRSQIKEVKCGWLYKECDEDGKDVYRLNDCGTPKKIKPEDVDAHLKTDLTGFKRNFDTKRKVADKDDDKKSKVVDKNVEEKMRSALYKYVDKLGVNFDEKTLEFRSAVESQLSDRFAVTYDQEHKREMATYSKSGNIGTLIVTGQPDKRQFDANKNKWKGKYFEFVFMASDNVITVDKSVVEDFISIHKNNYDYEHQWGMDLNSGRRIPVFFIQNSKGVDCIGLSYMFRIPSASFIKSAIPVKLQSSVRKDLAECIFGCVNEAMGSLKERVVFGPAFADGKPEECKAVRTVLASPKPSYGPLYVKNGSWNDESARIKGRKRYPVRENVLPPQEGTDATASSFIPLKPGTVFRGRIAFHNLRTCELGALISALTFNMHRECFHSIGGAKPYGYGKVELEIEKFNVKSIVDGKTYDGSSIGNFNEAFVSEMKKFDPQWENSASLRELFAMARGIRQIDNNDFSYMVMSTTRADNEFANNAENLPLFTDIKNPKSLASPSPRKRNSRHDVDSEIGLADSRFLRYQSVPSLIKARQFSEAEKIICEMEQQLDGMVRRDAAIYRKALSEAKMEMYGRSLKDALNALDDARSHFEQHKNSMSDDERNSMTASLTVIKETFSSLSDVKPSDYEMIQKNIAECESLKLKMQNFGKGISASLPERLIGTVAAYVGRVNRYMKENGELTDMDRDDIIKNISSLYPGLPSKERDPRRGRWSANQIRLGLLGILGMDGVDRLLKECGVL